jgi:hypothetical protein
MTIRKVIALALVWLMMHPALTMLSADSSDAWHHSGSDQTQSIKHLVVIFDENISFDPYFATYPQALNPGGEPAFHAVAGTPAINGLSGALSRRIPTRSTRRTAPARSIRFDSAARRRGRPIRDTATCPSSSPSTRG